jgi:hypothetical protein
VKKHFSLLGLIFLSAGHAFGANPVFPNSQPISMTFHEKDGHFDILARFSVEADKDLVWNTLTDYENYTKLSGELKKVTVTKRTARHMVVDEMAEGGFLFITQKVFFSLDVRMVPGRSIIGTDTGHKSFVSYGFRWDIKPGADGKTVELTYRLKAEGHFGGPIFMVNDHFQGGVKHFLEELRKEILRRQAQPTKEK